MSLQDWLTALVGTAFLFIFVGVLLFGIFSLEMSERKKRELMEEKKRYYHNINESLKKENLQNVDSEK